MLSKNLPEHKRVTGVKVAITKLYEQPHPD